MPTFTLSEIISRVYSRLEDNTVFYTAAEVTLSINEWVRVLNLHTGIQQATVNFSGGTQALRVFYDVPDGILFPTAVAFNGRQLLPSSFRAMAMRDRNWYTRTSANAGPVSEWMPMGLRKFAIHPADAAGGVTLAMTGVREPPLLVNSTDVVSIPDEFVEAIEEGAAYTLMLKEGGQVFAAASLSYQKFLAKLKELGRYRSMIQPRYFVEVREEKTA